MWLPDFTHSGSALDTATDQATCIMRLTTCCLWHAWCVLCELLHADCYSAVSVCLKLTTNMLGFQVDRQWVCPLLCPVFLILCFCKSSFRLIIIEHTNYCSDGFKVVENKIIDKWVLYKLRISQNWDVKFVLQVNLNIVQKQTTQPIIKKNMVKFLPQVATGSQIRWQSHQKGEQII